MEYYNEISVEDYCELREAVEWPTMPKAQAASGLEHSDYIIECIGFVDSMLKEGWRIKIVIVASKGKERFYEKFGFVERPNESEGAGMNMWREI